MATEIKSPYKGTKAYEVFRKIVNDFPENYTLYTLYNVGNNWYWVNSKGYLHILKAEVERVLIGKKLFRIEDCYISKSNMIVTKGYLVNGLYYKNTILSSLKQGISLKDFISSLPSWRY
jgi:hypothetical protein